MAFRFESLVMGALVIGSCFAGLSAHGDGHDDQSPVPMSCTGAGCHAIGFNQSGKADLITIDASSTTTLKPVSQSIVIECLIRPDDSKLDIPCGQVTIAYRVAGAEHRKWLKFNGSALTIPVHEDFGRYDIHVQPKACAIAKDIHNVLVGSVTNVTIRHCGPSRAKSSRSKK